MDLDVEHRILLLGNVVKDGNVVAHDKRWPLQSWILGRSQRWYWTLG